MYRATLYFIGGPKLCLYYVDRQEFTNLKIALNNSAAHAALTTDSEGMETIILIRNVAYAEFRE